MCQSRQHHHSWRNLLKHISGEIKRRGKAFAQQKERVLTTMLLR
jgi:hypothetical protein